MFPSTFIMSTLPLPLIFSVSLTKNSIFFFFFLVGNFVFRLTLNLPKYPHPFCYS